MQTAAVPHVRPLHLKRADTLILGTHHASLQHNLPPREQERERLAAVLRASEERIKIFCATIGTAQEITALVTAQQRAVAVHPTIAVVNRIYRSFAADLGRYSVFSRKKTDWEVLILPCSLANCPSMQRVTGLNFHIYDTSPPPPVISPPDEWFFLSRTCSGAELKQIVKKVRPSEIFTFGDYAKIYCHEFSSLCPRIRPLFAGNQPTLF